LCIASDGVVANILPLYTPNTSYGDASIFASQVTVPDQRLPVSFTLRAHVTTTDLLFSPPQLDFGPCVMAEDTGLVLRWERNTAHTHTGGSIEARATAEDELIMRNAKACLRIW
jgi:hypothetical protein